MPVNQQEKVTESDPPTALSVAFRAGNIGGVQLTADRGVFSKHSEFPGRHAVRTG